MTKHSFAPKFPKPPEPAHLPISGIIAHLGDDLNLSEDQMDAIEMELENAFGEGMYRLWNECPNAFAPSEAFKRAHIGIVVGQCNDCYVAGLRGYRCAEDTLIVEYTHPRRNERVCKEIHA